MMLVIQGQVAAYGGVLAGTLLLTLAVTLFARHYIALASTIPVVLLIDIVLVVVAIASSGAWESPFFFYASSSLVLPALLFGWVGGVMAGLAFVVVNQIALIIVGAPASDRFFEGTLAAFSVTLSMVAPSIFGALFPSLVERLRHQAAHHHYKDHQGSFRDEPFPPREPRLDTPRFTRPPREELRDAPIADTPLSAQLTRTRVEPGVEELRRIIFAPMPAPDMELSAIFDVLTTRFSQQTHVNARFSMIGRMRPMRATHRDLLIRLTQEALLNIQQHAHATSVSLTLRYDITSAALLIQDDGVGLIDGTYERPGLHALRAMHYRVAEFGGRLDVFETEGGGVTVRATLPLE
jgi:hypothetical protein